MAEWDADIARPIVIGAVKLKRGMFAAYPWIDDDDLRQEGMERARAMHAKYDQAKGAYTTWVYRAVHCALIDLERKCRCRAAHDNIAGEVAQARQQEEPVDDTPQTLAEWLGEVVRAGRRVFPPKRTGRPGYSPAAKLGAGLLMRRMGWSVREAQLIVGQKRELREAIGTPVPPSREFFRRANSFVSDNPAIARAVGKVADANNSGKESKQ